MRALLKLMAITPLLFLYLLISGSIRLLPVIDRRKRAVAVWTSSFFSRIMLSLLGVRVHVKHRERLRKTGDTLLIVSNHLSYVDVLVILSLMPSVFITSVELKNTALLGLLARLNGSIFVERRKPSGLKEEIRQIARALGQGMPVGRSFPRAPRRTATGCISLKILYSIPPLRHAPISCRFASVIPA